MDINSVFCTLQETADTLEVNRLTINRWIDSGKLEAQSIGGIVLIERAVIRRLKLSMRLRTRKSGARKRYRFGGEKKVDIEETPGKG